MPQATPLMGFPPPSALLQVSLGGAVELKLARACPESRSREKQERSEKVYPNNSIPFCVDGQRIRWPFFFGNAGGNSSFIRFAPKGIGPISLTSFPNSVESVAAESHDAARK